MTDETYKIRLTLSKNADPELVRVIDKLDSRRRSYRLIELAKLGLRVEGRMRGTLDDLMDTLGSRAESARPYPQHEKPTDHANSKTGNGDPFADDLKAFVDN